MNHNKKINQFNNKILLHNKEFKHLNNNFNKEIKLSNLVNKEIKLFNQVNKEIKLINIKINLINTKLNHLNNKQIINKTKNLNKEFNPQLIKIQVQLF